MARPTTAPRPARQAARVPSLSFYAAPLIGGVLLGAAEIVGGMLLMSPLFDRAEALPFLIVRTWLLLLGALCAAPWTWRRRLLLYGAALATAAGGETVLLLNYGATAPWPEMLRGLAAGALAALIADQLIQALRRAGGIAGVVAAGFIMALLIFYGSGTRPYEALLLGPTGPSEVTGQRPRLVLMTALPIVWGAGGAFDPNSRPAETYRLLEREFAVTPVDAIEPATLRGQRLMLLAQPRLLAPEELVALDEWVRGGGRVLVLTDPHLVAAASFDLTDARRPPAAGLLAPLLAHWGVELAPDRSRETEILLPSGGGRRKLVMLRPGRWEAAGASCRIVEQAWLARCRIGRGEALIVADADLLTDAAWVAPGLPRGHERHLRTADNPLIVADWLDGLAGVTRERADRPVAWTTRPEAD